MKKIPIAITCLLIVTLLFSSCGNVSSYDVYYEVVLKPFAYFAGFFIDLVTPPAAEQYANYEIIDPNLLWLQADEYLGYNGLLRYRKISGADDNVLVGAWELKFLGKGAEPIVLANPDNMPNIWEDWQINSVGIYSYKELYYADIDADISQPQDIIIKTPVAITKNAGAVSDALSLASSNGLDDSQGYLSGNTVKKLYNLHYNLRIEFVDYPDIVWETELEFYQSESDEDIRVFVYKYFKDAGMGEYIEFPVGSDLHSFIVESMRDNLEYISE